MLTIIITWLFHFKILSIENVERIMEETQEAVNYQRVNVSYHEKY